ncbi:50S ribosomal protein L17 [Halanaerocella petrolearia]
MARRKLNRESANRKALLTNLANNLFKNGRVETTIPKAKEAGRFAEKMITKAKKGSQHARRQVMNKLQDEESVTVLFDELADRFAERPGGYTRVIKLGERRGDGTQMGILELVE